MNIVHNQVNCGVSRDVALHTVCTNMVQQVHLLGVITNEDAARILGELSDGPWLPEHTEALVAAVESVRVTSERAARPTKLPSQKCLHFEQYLTEDEWAIMATQSAEHAVQCTVATRACKINLNNGCEKTLNRMVRVVAVASGWDWCTQHRVTTCKEQLKSLIQQGQSDPRLPRLLESLVFLLHSCPICERLGSVRIICSNRNLVTVSVSAMYIRITMYTSNI